MPLNGTVDIEVSVCEVLERYTPSVKFDPYTDFEFLGRLNVLSLVL